MIASKATVAASLCVPITFGILASPARGQLVEGNVLLLWNSKDDESSRIRQKYMELHPGVVEFDLKIDYADFPPNSILNTDAGCSGSCDDDCPGNHECVCCSCPTLAVGSPPEFPLKAMNKYYITPSMFEDVRQQIIAFLNDYKLSHPPLEYEPILAIATTRGLPAAISMSFDAVANHSGQCIQRSFEAALARLGVQGTPGPNPYKGRLGRNFKWLFSPCGGQQHLAGKIFLVSRLDSDDADADGDYADDVIALLERSQNLVVNKFGVTIVYDKFNSSVTSGPDTPTARYMRDRRWCVYYETGPKFLHGVNNSSNVDCGQVEPHFEGLYNSWPELAHVTLGRNHRVCGDGSYDCGEPVCMDYARWYQPHPAGYFESLESWNGVALRMPGWPPAPGGNPGEGWQQGSVLHWIAAGGSFTLGRVNGTGANRNVFVIPNLYEHSLSWGEAVWTGLEHNSYDDKYLTPIGDPLARVIVYDPDVDANGVIDVFDVQLVMTGEFDINQDGIVDEDDLQLVTEVYGRSAWELPEDLPGNEKLVATDIPASPCGDVNRDGTVNDIDLGLIDNHIETADCPGLDINRNGIVDLVDRAVVEDHMPIGQNGSWCIGDVNLDGVINASDINVMNLYLFAHNYVVTPDNPDWNAIYNINCDGIIDRLDFVRLQSLYLSGQICPPSN